MKRKLFRIAITLITLTAIASFGMVAYNLTKSSETNNVGNGAISLEAPLFTSVAEAATKAGDAFPTDKAGIAAYVKLSEIDIEKIKSIFPDTETEVVEVGDDYTIGIVPISNFGGNIDVHLYADTEGWLVAYLEKNEWASKIMQWEITEPQEPDIGLISTTTLEDALNEAKEASGVEMSLSDVKYYNFEFPDADSMTLFVKTATYEEQNKVVKIEIPATYTLYEASYYHYTYHAGEAKLRVDGKTVSSSLPYSDGWGRAFDSYEETITPGTLHKIEIYCPSSYSSGVATVLICKAK